LLCDAGRWSDAARCLEYGDGVATPAHYLHEQVLRLGAGARLAAHGRAHERAREQGERALASAEGAGVPDLRALLWYAAAEVARSAGRRTEAADALERARAEYEAKGNAAALASLAVFAAEPRPGPASRPSPSRSGRRRSSSAR